MNYVIRLALWIVLLCIAPIRYLWASCIVLSGGDRGWQCLIAEDESWNVPWGGKASMTISARAEYARKRGSKWGCWLCQLLDYIHPNHCENAIK